MTRTLSSSSTQPTRIHNHHQKHYTSRHPSIRIATCIIAIPHSLKHSMSFQDKAQGYVAHLDKEVSSHGFPNFAPLAAIKSRLQYHMLTNAPSSPSTLSSTTSRSRPLCLRRMPFSVSQQPTSSSSSSTLGDNFLPTLLVS